jgi:hypothetical protein
MRSLILSAAIAAVTLSATASAARAEDFLERLLGQHHKDEYWGSSRDWKHARGSPTSQARGGYGAHVPRAPSQAVVMQDPVDKE